MRSNIPTYRFVAPKSLSETVTLLAHEPGIWQPFAGGTDLMVLLEAGKLPHKNYVNIWNLPELRGIEVSAEQISLGALTTYTEVQRAERERHDPEPLAATRRAGHPGRRRRVGA